MPEQSSLRCRSCGAEHRWEGVLPRNSICERCSAFLHCCSNCAFHDESAYNQCNESSADRVVDKETANFCDFFRGGGTDPPVDTQDKSARAQLEGLFRKDD